MTIPTAPVSAGYYVPAGQGVTIPRQPSLGRPAIVAVSLVVMALSALGLIVTGCSTGKKMESRPGVVFSSDDRVLVLAPHPDDESLGAGGVIQGALSAGAAVRVVYLTYGDSNEWSFVVYRKRPTASRRSAERMGEIRRGEALAACDRLGVSADDVFFLGYPDFGTLPIWQQHWGESPPLRSLLTHVRAVPYEDAYRPGAPYKGEEILGDITAILRDFRPTKVFLSHPADQNPDHEALYLFARVALWDLGDEMSPKILPYVVHYGHWPVPSGFHPGVKEEPPTQVAGDIVWMEVSLTPDMTGSKKAAVSLHRTQMEYAKKRLLSFVRANEIFGDYPEIALTRGGGAVHLLPETVAGAEDMNEHLTRAERATFVGFEERAVGLDVDTLVVSITLSRPLVRGATVGFQIFGYRQDTPFEKMPKLNLRMGLLGIRVSDQRRALPRRSVKVTRDGKHVVARVPLSSLGEPEKVLLGGRTYIGRVPLDKVDWRVVLLPPSE